MKKKIDEQDKKKQQTNKLTTQEGKIGINNTRYGKKGRQKV